MPTTGIRPEDKLIDLLLSVYEDGTWGGTLSARSSPERVADSGVEMLATRAADGRTLAIEHTLIEPRAGERSDFYRHFQKLQQQLRADQSLLVPGCALYVEAPLNVLPHGSNWQGIITEVADWLRDSCRSFPPVRSQQRCRCPSHPDGELTFQVALQPIDSSKSFLIIQRYGPIELGDTVENALRRKLPKLCKTSAATRMLLLERDQGWITAEDICGEVERLRPQCPQLASVDEIWIADTASFEDKGRYVCFSQRKAGSTVESFAFYDEKLISHAKDGMPIPIGPRTKTP